MKILLTVSKDNKVIRESLMDIGNVVVAATLELMEGNCVAMIGIQEEYNPDSINFDMRESRTVN